MLLTFDQFQIDTEAFELRKAGQLCKVEPKIFDLIALLASRPEQVFSHEELLEQVWQGRLVAESTVTTCIKNARKILGDSGDTQRYIKTIRGRGYRFGGVLSSPAPSSDTKSPAQPDNTPALLVLPFRPLGAEPHSAELSDALAVDLGTILNRVPLLRLGKAHRPIDTDGLGSSPRKLHEHLGVDFVLDGTLQTVGGGIRVNAQLADARTGFQLWGERFAIAATPDEAVEQAAITIIGKLEPQLQRAIYDIMRSHDGEPSARQLFLEASSTLAIKGWRHEVFEQVAALLRRSRDQDPEFALAHSLLALVVGFGDRLGLAFESARSEAQTAAERAIELDSASSTVLGHAGCALADLGFTQRALPLLRNAVDLNSANAQAWVALGSTCLLEGRLDDGISYLKHGIAISPLDTRLSIWGTLLSVGLLHAGQLDEALEQGELACRRDARCYLPRLALAGIHLLRDQSELSRDNLAEARRIKPDLSHRQIGAVLGRELAIALRLGSRSTD